MQHNARAPLAQRLQRDMARHWRIYTMLLPALAFYILFAYGPMYGATIAFKDFNPSLGIAGSPFVGLKHFEAFFTSYYFGRLLRNTLLISAYSIIFSFPVPILLAIMLNEARNNTFRRLAQTVTYLPHFISLMVICGLIIDFSSIDGLFNDIAVLFGGTRKNLLMQAGAFRPIYIISGIWQEMGWQSIVYLAALTAIDPQLYEAARIDGAGRLKQIWHVTLPGLLPTIMVLLILRMGRVMNVGFEKIILLYNPSTYETADVISSFVYRKGLQEFGYSYSAAVGLFNSVINFAIVILSNTLSRRVNETSLW